MPSAPDQGGPLYSRGRYRLEWDRKRDGSLRSPFPQIVWYDAAAGRNRSKSAGTADIAEAEDELDKLYLQRERGQAVCPTCGQPRRAGSQHLVTVAIADYLVARESKPSIGSIRPRLAHVTAYLESTDQLTATCEQIDEDWIETFREWALEVPIVTPSGVHKERTLGTVEASVRQLAAVINFAHDRKDTLFPAAFSARSPDDVSRTPTYRASIETLGAMFAYATKLDTKGKSMAGRAALLRFLQLSVATWARPDAVHDVSTDKARQQWIPDAGALNLNPKGRAQTRKYRPVIPVPERVAKLLEGRAGSFVGVDSVRTAFNAMLDDLKLPRDGETGLKLIRRSMAQLARRQLGEEHWVQGQRMLGHMKSSSSDIYGLFEIGQLGRALAVTNAIMDGIEKVAPEAFHRTDTGLKLVVGGKNG